MQHNLIEPKHECERGCAVVGERIHVFFLPLYNLENVVLDLMLDELMFLFGRLGKPMSRGYRLDHVIGSDLLSESNKLCKHSEPRCGEEARKKS